MKIKFSLLAVFLVIPAAVQAEAWNGCYGGLNGGVGLGRNKGFDNFRIPSGSNSPTGALAGGQLGCDVREQNWVIGAQGSFDASSLDGTNPYFNGTSPSDHENYKLRWMPTLTGRAGYVFDEVNLLYAKGGVAWGHYEFHDNDPSFPYRGPATWTAMGLLVGAGAERKLTDHISLFAEYGYIAFDKTSAAVNYDDIGPLRATFKQNLQQFLVGVNYHF